MIQNHLSSRANGSSVLLGNISYSTLPNKIVIRIPYYSNLEQPFSSLDTSKLGSALQSFYLVQKTSSQMQVKKGYHLEMRFIPLQYPYLDSHILSQYVAINAGKYNFSRIQKLLFNKVYPMIDSSNTLGVYSEQGAENAQTEAKVSGVKMELSGRLTTQRSIPRKTVSNAHIGQFSSTSKNTLSSENLKNKSNTQYSSKNKLGAFTIKV